MGANDEKAGHGPEEKGVRSGRSSRTNWQGGEGEANKIPVEVGALCNFFLKVQQQLKSAKNNLKNQTFFMRKGRDQEDHQGQIGKEGRGKPTRSCGSGSFM